MCIPCARQSEIHISTMCFKKQLKLYRTDFDELFFNMSRIQHCRVNSKGQLFVQQVFHRTQRCHPDFHRFGVIATFEGLPEACRHFLFFPSWLIKTPWLIKNTLSFFLFSPFFLCTARYGMSTKLSSSHGLPTFYVLLFP